MVKLSMSCLVIIVLCVSNVYAQESGFGLGIILGEPTGLSCKIWTTSTTAVDAAAAWSFADESALHLHADYLFHNFSLIDVERGLVPLYFGIGGRIKLEDDSKVGVRIPVGIGYFFEGAPLDFFLELVPILDLAPDTEFEFNGALGLRYFF